MMDIKPDFSDRLNKVMLLKNISAYKLSKEINMGQSIISEYKKGKIIPKLATIKLIASILEISEEWLISEKGDIELFKKTPLDRNDYIDSLNKKIKSLESDLEYYKKISENQDSKIILAISKLETKIDLANSENKMIFKEIQEFLDYESLKSNIETGKKRITNVTKEE